MKLSADALEALEIIRPRIEDKNVILSKGEFLALKVVYENINHVFNNMKITLSDSCSACVPDAMKIVRNYIARYDTPIVKKPSVKAEVVMVDFADGKDEGVTVISFVDAETHHVVPFISFTSDKQVAIIDGIEMNHKEAFANLSTKSNKELKLMIQSRGKSLPLKINKENLINALLS